MMISSLQPVQVYGKHGPNPPKIAMLCEELSIPHHIQDIQFADLKKPDFLALNPNGRMPVIHDPNTGLTIWESGAIMEYLIDTYDTKHKLSFVPGSHESYLAKQWLFFQVSGQGPYYGQAVWFTKHHPESIPSVQQRYFNETKRVTAVLETHLKKQEPSQDGPWLVGGKFSYADLAFIPWQNHITMNMDQIDVSEYTVVADWLDRMKQRASVAKVLGL